MGNLVNALRQLVREELNEMSAPSFALKVTDLDKAKRIKNLHSDHWVSKLIDLIIDSGEEGITRNEAAEVLGIKPMRLNDELIALKDSGIISRKRLTPEKPEKEPGQKGRKADPNSKTGKIESLRLKFIKNPDYDPTEDDITYNIPKGLGTEKLSDADVIKTKNSALGLTKRGRPASGGAEKSDILSKVQKSLNKESLYEAYRRLQSIK